MTIGVSSEKEKISLYQVDKKKGPQKATSLKSNGDSAVIMPIKDYMEKVASMKSELQQSCLKVEGEREFIPNLHLSVGEMP